MNPVLGLLIAVAVLVAPGRRRGRRPPVDGQRGSADRWWRPVVAEGLDRAVVAVEVDQLPRLWGASAIVGGLGGLAIAGAAGLVVGGFAGTAGPPLAVLARGDRRRHLVVAAFPELLELVARGLRGGTDLRTALSEAAAAVPRAGRGLTEALARADAGVRLGEALDHWVATLDHPDAPLVRAVVRLGDETGASMAPALDRAAATLRERAAQRDEIVVLTAQTRASAMVVALAPVAFLGVVALTDRGSAGVLLTTGWGRLCLVAGLLLDALGVVWMRRLTEAVAR